MQVTMTEKDMDDIAARVWVQAKKNMLNQAASDETWATMEKMVQAYARSYWVQFNFIPEVEKTIHEMIAAEFKTTLKDHIKEIVRQMLSEDKPLADTIRTQLIQAATDTIRSMSRESLDD